MASSLESKLVVSDPDFDIIKANLKNFLRSQSAFSDYDFDGSALSVLVDLLAYNTHYKAFYANMLANESFLDTATLRDSVVSHAKMLGYTPTSSRSARAVVNLTFAQAQNPAISSMSALTIPRFTRFASSALNGVNYIFSTKDEITVRKTNNSFVFSNLNIYEGKPVNYVYTYNALANPTQEFVLPDANIDTSTLQVIIQNSTNDLTQSTYYLSTDATTVDASSKVYYLDEISGQKYKIYFGDNILGKSLSDGNIVIISYIITAGDASNKATGFTLLDNVGGLASGNVSVTQVASGGAAPETVSSVKYSAPKNFVSNNRAVTKNDYISILKREYPAFESITVWGGEENSPPVYGKIFISAKPAAGYQISTAEKQYITNELLSPYSVMTVVPEFVDPDYNYLNLNIAVNYDPTATNKTVGQIETTVRGAVYNYANTYLDTFNSFFKISKLMKEIDSSDTAISGNQVDIWLEKRFSPVISSARNYVLQFNTPLKRGSTKQKIYSSPSYSGYDAEENYRNFFFEEVPEYTTGIDSISIVSGGSGFITAPTIKIEGDGIGATAVAYITNGKITSISITHTGAEYSAAIAKAYDLDGNVLNNVSLIVNVQNKIGKLRSYYFDNNNVKVIYSTGVGTIDYSTGTITLNNFNPLAINNPLKIMKIYAIPEDKLFGSSRNSIITLDLEDSAAVTISASPVAS
jgi:hypothetical protein